jgi:hypothetical protein
MASLDFDVRPTISIHRQHGGMDDRGVRSSTMDIYNLMRTADGYSDQVSSGNAGFTLLGFMGMYAFISILFRFLMFHIIGEGPRAEVPAPTQELGTIHGEA